MTLTTLPPAEAAARLNARRAVLIDIREADEFAREKIAGARHAPLSTIDPTAVACEPGQQVIYTCRTGNRTGLNGARLAGLVPAEAFVLEGGLDGWKAQGLPTSVDTSQPIDLMRQVMITAGSLVLIGALLGLFVHPGFWGVTIFVGAGLVFSGVTGMCAMARMLAMAPWNRQASAVA